MNLSQEFDRQVKNLYVKGYLQHSTISEAEFKQELEKLKEKLPQDIDLEVDLQHGILPFVVVVSHNVVRTAVAMTLIDKNNRQGIEKLFPHESSDFSPIADVTIPSANFYLLIDIDRGKANINLSPNKAMEIIKAAGRSPLTIDEGIAIVTQFPEFLIKNNCFSLLASRHQGDQRVPAIWINGQKQVNLGWCWDGNPHTWLGSASCKSRVTVE